WADTFTAMGMNTTARCEKTQIFSLALPTPNSIGCGFGNIGVLTRSSFGAEVIPTWVGTNGGFAVYVLTWYGSRMSSTTASVISPPGFTPLWDQNVETATTEASCAPPFGVAAIAKTGERNSKTRMALPNLFIVSTVFRSNPRDESKAAILAGAPHAGSTPKMSFEETHALTPPSPPGSLLCTAIFKIVRMLRLNSQVVQAAGLINLSVSAWRAA